MKNSSYKIWLYFLVFFSLFSGLPLNGNWFFGYDYTFISGPEVFLHQYQNGVMEWNGFINWLVMIIAHLALFSFPFVFNKVPLFKVWLIIVPLIFLVTQYNIMGPFIFAFAPFILIWFVLLIAKPKLIVLNIN
ncbi:MAG: hypothetical protein ACQUHE_11535 [Bacteroidia bacterium]